HAPAGPPAQSDVPRRPAVTGRGASQAAAALIKGAMTTMLLGKVKTLAMMLVLIGAAGLGAALLWERGLGAPADEPPSAPQATDAKADLYGDPLPDGAVARMGSVQFRHAGVAHFGYRDGGKTSVTVGNDRVLRFWDAASGREVRTVILTGAAASAGYRVLSPDTKVIATFNRGEILISDVDSGKELKKLPGPKKDMGYMLFSP